MDAHSRYIIARAIEHANGNQTKAAEALKLQRTYLARLIKQQRERRDDEGMERNASTDLGQYEDSSRAG
jgi:DNA-binding NtrC family response regulator